MTPYRAQNVREWRIFEKVQQKFIKSFLTELEEIKNQGGTMETVDFCTFFGGNRFTETKEFDIIYNACKLT